MARNRLRPTWIQKVYQYGLMTNEPISDVWWNEHKEMCFVWNKLVDKREELRPLYDQIVLGNDELQELSENLIDLNNQKAAIWEKIKQQRVKDKSKTSSTLTELSKSRSEIIEKIRQTTISLHEKKIAFKATKKESLSEFYELSLNEYKEIVNNSGIYWANRQMIRDNFNAALKNPVIHKKNPHRKDIIFCHSYSSGGITEKSLTNVNKRCYIEPINWDAVDMNLPQRQWKKLVRTKVHFFVNGDEKIFSCVFHRPLPKDCFIKNVILSGRWIENKIKWSLSISVEILEENMIQVPHDRRCVAINTNWRITEEGLRIAALVDDDGNSSIITLPQLEETHRLPSNDIIKSVEYRKRLSTVMSNYIDKLRKYINTEKFKLVGIDKQLFINMHVANRGRFFKIAKCCAENGYTEEANFIYTILNKYKRTLIRFKNHRQNMIRRRKQFYYDIAHSVCRKYHTIVMDDSNLKKLGMTTKRDENGLDYSEIAQKYKAEAAIGDFRNILKMISKKYTNTVVVPQDSSWISLKHFSCGHTQNKHTDKLLIQCEKCGVVYDRDKNAALNIMAGFKKSEYMK